MSVVVVGVDGFRRPYTASIGLTAEQFDELIGHAYGETVRIDNATVADLMKRAHGTDVGLTPVGPHVPLHDYDVGSVIAWLTENTRILTIHGWEGDPRIPTTSDPDTIY